MKFYILLFIYLLFNIPSFSQKIEGVVKGKEGSSEMHLPGVNIIWQGTTIGTSTDANGRFSINKPKGAHMLEISFVGYEPKIVHIDNTDDIKIVLEPNLELEEVTVVERDKGTYLSAINPIHSHKITGAELHKAACCNLAESFETNPSVDVSYSDAVTGAKQIKLLGLAGTYSKLQTENIPNLDGLATNYGLTYIPGPWMESIQVSKGTSSVQNGYESITGQVNVEYKKPDSNEKIHLNLFNSAEGKMEFNGNGNIKVKGDTLTTGLFIHAQNLEKKNDHNNDGFLDEPLMKQIHLLNRWKYIKGNYMAQAGVNFLTEERTGGQVSFNKNSTRNSNNPYGVNIQTNRIEGFFKSGYVFPNQKSAIALLTNTSYHDHKSFYGLNDFNADELKFYANLVYTQDLDQYGFHTLNSGASYTYDRFNEYLKMQPEFSENNFFRKESIPGIFTEYTYKPNPTFTLMAGIRADIHNLYGTLITPRMHLRYAPSEHFVFRASAGKGYRTANVLSDNSFLLATSRNLDWQDDSFLEEAWNFGISMVQSYKLFERDLQINTEFYRTSFIEQLIIDRESSSSEILLYPLDGKSYANSFQVDLKYELFKDFEMLLAYRSNDVKQTIGGELKEKPLTSRYKGLVTFNYATNLKKWMFDYTIQFNGGGRIPRYDTGSELNYPSDYFEFAPYTVMNAQITKYFRNWNIYIGSENFTNFRQKTPIISANDPYSEDFDATNIWGPVLGRRIYLGLRFTLNY